MKTLLKHIHYESREDVIRLWHITDTHLGSRSCNEALLKKHIQQIANDPLAYWGFGGDAIDGICQAGDKRYSVATLAKWIHDAYYKDQNVDTMGIEVDYFVEMFRPIWHKCLWFGKGNHEWASERFYARNIYMEMVKAAASIANVDPRDLALGAQGFIDIRFKQRTPAGNAKAWTFHIYQHHGYGGGAKAGGHALALEHALGTFDADLLLFGHRHVRAFVDRLIHRADKSGWHTAYRAAMFSPSYLDAWIEPSKGQSQTDTYAEREGYMPRIIGAAPILIHPDSESFSLQFGSPGMSYHDVIGVPEVAATE